MSRIPCLKSLSTIRIEKDEDGALQSWWEQGELNTVGLSDWFVTSMDSIYPAYLSPSHLFWSVGETVKIDGVGTFTIIHYDADRGDWYLEKNKEKQND